MPDRSLVRRSWCAYYLPHKGNLKYTALDPPTSTKNSQPPAQAKAYSHRRSIWMQQEPDSPEHHRQRSEFIRKLVQRRVDSDTVHDRYGHRVPRTIVQFWHDHRQLPHDVEECIGSWTHWEKNGFTHRLFDEHAAKAFISGSLSTRHRHSFERCYHPAMQAD